MRHQQLILSALLLLGLGLTGLQAQGNALAFNGTNQYVEAPNANIPSSGDFTVSVWAKHDPTQNNGTQYYEILSQGTVGNAFYIGKNEFGKIRVGQGWDSNYNFPTDGDWHNFTVVKSATNTWLYLDGSMVETKGDAIPNPTNTVFRISHQFPNSYPVYYEYFKGSIDEIQIWNRALSACEIEANYDKELTGYENGLVAYYNFNETTGTTLTDIVGTNNGILYSSPAWEASGASISGTRPDVVVSTESVSDITASSASVSYTIDYGTATTRGIVYGTSPCPDISGSKIEESGSFGTGSFSGSLSSLVSGTTYYVRAYAINPSGTSYGTEVSFTAENTPPTITSFDPISGEVGETVTITGTNFNINPANNVVFFGATQATVSASSATSLTVTVPTGASYAPITVLNTETTLAAYSLANFNPTFSPNTGHITTADIAAKVDYTAGTYPWSVAIGDIDGDGKPDLVVANINSNTVSVFRNIGSGTLSFDTKVDFTTGNSPASVAIGDIDGDGKLDLVVANSNSATVSVLRNSGSNGTISFDAKVDFTTGTAPKSVAIGDIDGDGKPDLAVTNSVSTVVSVFRNTGSSGTVSFDTKVDFTTGNSPYSVAIGDMDGDGKPDLAVANQGSNTVSVLRNIGSSGTLNFATKVDFAVGTSPYSVAIGDIDGDGKPDLAVVNYYSDAVSVLHNTGISGTVSFATKVDLATGRHPASVAIGDIDGDGKPDLAVANTNSDNVSVFRNIGSSGTPGFAEKVDFTTGNSPNSVAIGDMDGDGKPDLATTNSSANQVSVLRNMPAFSSTVTTLAVSDISTNAATGNGDITDLGIPDPTAHGVCWNTSGTPTTDDDVVDNGAASTTGAFTSNITSLSAGTEYFVRAYVTNSAGTSYGSEVSFTTKQSQTITFNALTDKTYGDADYSPDATAGSGLTVSYSSSNTNVATIVSGKIHIVAPGICTIYADQGGDASYDAAPQVSQALTVNTATLSVTAENKSKEYDGTVYSPFTVSYSGFVNGEDEADLSGTLTFSGTATTATDVGTAYVITPAGLSSANYNITFENGSLDITQAAQSITFDPLETKVEGDAPFELAASSTSDLSISYTSSDPDVATISGSTVTIVGAGSTKITASQSGNDNYSPALPVEQMLTVHIYIAGDIDRNGSIDGTEIAGDANGNGIIDGTEIAGDTNGNGSIDGTEIAGDANGNGIIDGTEIAGDTNGNGSIDGTEIAGDTNGSGSIDEGEITGDINGNGSIDGDEIAGDANGNGSIDGDEIADSIAVADKESFEVAMYPNPVRGIVHLDITTSNVQNVKLTLVDITGRLLLQKQISAAEHITLDMSGEVSGIYFVKLDFEGKQVLKKLVVE